MRQPLNDTCLTNIKSSLDANSIKDFLLHFFGDKTSFMFLHVKKYTCLSS